MDEKKFREMFFFKPELSGRIGIERECFLARDGQIVPIAPEIIPSLGCSSISYELSACQLESHVGPVEREGALEALKSSERVLLEAERVHRFERWHMEVAPENMPLDIYPDPQGRYQRIAEQMPKEMLLAACRVAGTHVHIGMPDAETALQVYQRVVTYWAELASCGDFSGGERLGLYRKVVSDPTPWMYESWHDFYCKAQVRGFAHNPRNCWDLIRISCHGTIEFRMFGATSDLSRIIDWAHKCWQICWG